MKDEFIRSGSLIRLDQDSFLIGWGLRTWIEVPIQKACFYFPDFFLKNQKPWFFHEHSRVISIDDLIHLLPINYNKKTHFYWNSPYKDTFYKEFDKLQSLFSKKYLEKAVPYIFQETIARYTCEDLQNSLSKVLKFAKSFSLHVYGFWDETEGILGASPEILFEKKQEFIETIACAGTASNKRDKVEFIQDEKEVREHFIVVEGISQVLRPFGQVEIGQMQVLELPKISHLITPIQLKAKTEINYSHLIEALHPTPALGAYPKEEGKRWLVDYDALIKRNRFGAPIGCITDKGNLAKFIVAIRNLQWNNNHMRIGAGCGVISSSVADNEWNELILKSNFIKEILDL